MPENVSALIYVLILATPSFILAKRICVPMIDEQEFGVWWKSWFATTLAVFLSPNFYLFTAALFLITTYVRRSSRQPLCLYVMLMFVAPCIMVKFGIPGVMNKIIDMNPPRLLSLFLLVPLTVSIWKDPKNRLATFPDVLAGCFFMMLTVLAVRFGDVNSFLRAVVGYILDLMLPYFVFSRAFRTPGDVNRVLLAFAVAAVPISLVGVLEFVRDWRVYYSVLQRWDLVIIAPYLFRDGMLRAATTAIEPITFGFVCMTALGSLVAIRPQKLLGNMRFAVGAVLVVGLLSSISRGPWLGFALCVSTLVLVHFKTSIRFTPLLVPAFLALMLFSSSPVVSRFVSLLPFIGTQEKSSETYRSDLFDNAMIVVERNPLLGSVNFLAEPEMQRMIQGQEIIDIVNSYLQIALEFGLISLFFFVSFFVVICARLGSYALRRPADPVNYSAITALLLAMLFTIVTTSSVSFIPYLYWSFAGIAVALLRGLSAEEGVEEPEAAPTMRVIGAH